MGSVMGVVSGGVASRVEAGSGSDGPTLFNVAAAFTVQSQLMGREH